MSEIFHASPNAKFCSAIASLLPKRRAKLASKDTLTVSMTVLAAPTATLYGCTSTAQAQHCTIVLQQQRLFTTQYTIGKQL